MPTLEGMTRLETRKRELLLESDLNRKVLQLEAAQWQLRAARWTSRMGKVQGLARIVSPLAQGFFARKTGWLARSVWGFIARRF